MSDRVKYRRTKTGDLYLVNLLGRRELTKRVADVLEREYGSTLKEYGTDVQMAEAVVRNLRDFLSVSPDDISLKEYRAWKEKRDPVIEHRRWREEQKGKKNVKCKL